ncbi:MAG: tetratricopeptide repeat protein [Candidatus Marinimicrobia bacterium]|nr:tetratricopeptide repeat protein [Candidatus Neomarinimicrobiota bacterium]
MKKEMSQNRKTKIDDIQALMSSGKKQDYETALQKLKAIDNQKDFIVKYLKGLILTDLSDHFPADPPQYTQAIEELKKANKLNPDDFNILYTLARAFLGKDYLKDAEDYFIKAAELISSQNFISKGSWQEITNYFEQNNIFSNSSKNKPSELLDKWDFYLDWGRLLFKREKYTEGDLKFRIAVALCQNEYSWMIYDHWGRSVYEANINPNSAYKLFQKAFDSSPNDIQFYLYWADALSGDEYEDFETAFILYKEAANLLPGEYKVYSKWGRALFESQNYNEAIEKFSKAHELEKNDWLIYYYKGVSFLHLKKLENSISNFEIAIQLIEPKDPDISFLYQRWGQALIRIGEVIKGKDCFEKAVRLSPEKWEMFIIWGNELEELNKYDEAFVVYNNALNVSKYSGDIDAQSKSIIYESRGFCAVEMGKRSIALENFNSAKEFSNSTNLDKIISYLEDCINDRIEAESAKIKKERDKLKRRIKQLESSNENGKLKKQKQIKEKNSSSNKSKEIKHLKAKNWSQVTIELVSDDSILVKAPDFKTKRFNYTDLGMRDDRRGDMPNQLWLMIKNLAENNGVLPTDEMTYHRRGKIEKTIQRLRTHFKTLFGIGGMPINRFSKKHGYVTQFNIKDCRPTSYNQPFLE